MVPFHSRGWPGTMRCIYVFTSITCDIKARSPCPSSTRQTAHMDSQLSLSPVDYDPYSNARQSEGTWSPDSYIHTRTRTPDSYQYTSTQGSVRRRTFVRPRDYEQFSLFNSPRLLKTLASSPLTTPLPSMTLMLQEDTLVHSTFPISPCIPSEVCSPLT